MRLKSFFRLIILVSFIQSVSSTAQTVEYDTEVGSLPSINEIFDDGSLHTTKIEENSTFYLDSVSPHGVDIPLNDFEVYDSASYIWYYNYTNSNNLIVSRSISDTSIYNGDCGVAKITKYDSQGGVIWEFVDDTTGCNFYPRNTIHLNGNNLFSISRYLDEDGCTPEIKLLKLDFNTGQLIKRKTIGYCSYKWVNSIDGDLKFIHHSNCSCNDSEYLQPDQIETFDENFNRVNSSRLILLNEYGDSVMSVNTTEVDSNTYLSRGLRRQYSTSNNKYSLLRLENSNQITRYSLYDTLNLNEYMSRLYDVIVYDTFYLIAFGHNYTNLVRLDEYYRYDSTEVNIICVTKDFTQIGNIWTEVKLGEVYHLNLEHHFISEDDGSLYLSYSKHIGTSINRERKNYIERISFNSIINSVEPELKNNELTFEVYPNPTSGEINIETSNSGKLEFYDLAGKRQLVSNINAGSNKLEINQLPVGVYFLVLTTEDGNRTTQKLIIQ